VKLKMTFLLATGFLLSTASSYALELTVKNHSKATIEHVYFSPASQKNWGPDQLGDDTIEPEHFVKWHGIEAGKYDVKLVTHGGKECEVDDAEFDSDMEWDVTTAMIKGCDEE
jgi:hypothetical protein